MKTKGEEIITQLWKGLLPTMEVSRVCIMARGSNRARQMLKAAYNSLYCKQKGRAGGKECNTLKLLLSVMS